MTKIIVLILILAAIQCSLQILEEKADCDAKGKTKTKPVNCFSYLDDCIRQDMRTKGYSEEPKYKKFAFCWNKRRGFMTEEGELNCEKLKGFLTRFFPKNGEAVYEKCAKQFDTPEETAFQLEKCIQQTRRGVKKTPAKKADDE